MMECWQARLEITLQGSLARWQFQNDVKCVVNDDSDDGDCDGAAVCSTQFAYL